MHNDLKFVISGKEAKIEGITDTNENHLSAGKFVLPIYAFLFHK